MIKIKKIIFFIIKLTLVTVVLLTLILFFYTAFFYEPSSIEKKVVENKIIKEEEKKLKESQIQEKISDTTQDKKEIKQVKTTIKDGLYATVGNKPITKSDIVNEVKTILILNNMTYSEDKQESLQRMAVKSIINKSIKEIEIDKNNFLQFNQDDINNELTRLASKRNIDIITLKKICASNGLDFSIIENQIKTELLWNSLIFYLYGDRLSINLNEIDEQLKLSQNKKKYTEYLISEILIKSVERDKLKPKIEEIKNQIKIEGFENVAMNLSISQTAIKGGDLGWLNESVISKKFKSIILNTPIGGLSEPTLSSEGILIFKVRDKRKIEKKIDLEKLKKQLVNAEKTKILHMYSMSHFDNLRRSTSINFFNE